MRPLLYTELVPWYRLVDPPQDHEDEAACYREALERAASPSPQTLLELGAGAGHNAVHLKQRFRCTLSDLSPEMSALSRELNPECEHVLGDMRTLRLGRTFDTVLVHDAVMYMLTEADLRAAIETAFLHTRPGGAAIFAPDCVRETFAEGTEVHTAGDGDRALSYLQWVWDPDPTDTSILTEFAFLLRENGTVTAVHDRHEEGLFPRKLWLELLRGAGYQRELIERPIGGGEVDEIFLCRRP